MRPWFFPAWLLSALLLAPLASADAQPAPAKLHPDRSIATTAQSDPPDTGLVVRSGPPFRLGMLMARRAATEVALKDSEIDSLLQAAVAHAHAADFGESIDDYHRVLAADPLELRALDGLGYAHLWNGRTDSAAVAFNYALSVAPDDRDAAKGLAYAALQSGRNREAAARFGALAAAAPEDLELQLAHGEALLRDRRSSEAEPAFERALVIDPRNRVAREGLLRARNAEPLAEITGYFGVTWFTDPERPRANPSSGFRFVEVAVWPDPATRLWFQYDNGLTLDNVVLSAGNREVPAGYVGGYHAWSPVHTTRLELGWRALPGTVDQTIVRSEHVVTLRNGLSARSGLWLGFRSDERVEWIAHGGASVPVTPRLSINPTYFLARNGMPNENEWRVLLAGEYRTPDGLRVAAGYAFGQAETGYADDFRSIGDGYLKLSAPVGRSRTGHVLVRTEFVGRTDAITTLSVGVTFGFSER